ncbi:MAG: 2-succinyl-6-hydroxy-2,4-cyclohexadiene-1-carboxylate synthase [Deltaproteobacteria bacterium]|nr:2-succinyl-6-hydroxy-2,4-cyclohexadiene-1-carboxylate synthase [Deltaproteobacteria bacterium]
MTARVDGEVRFVEAGGVRLRAVIEGEGESLLVLHGFTGAAESMACVSDPLRASYRVARLELVGHGQSEAPDRVEAYSMDACALQIAEASRALGLERPHLLGYSMGGRAALAAAVLRPAEFASLILVGATAGIADPVLRRERIASDEALADRIERDGIESFVDDWMALPIFASQSCLGAGALERARIQRLENRPEGLARSLRGMGAGAQRPLHDQLDRVVEPVLLVVGERDTKFRGLAASLEAAVPDARTKIVAGAGHAAHLEAPETFAAIAIEFLAEVGRRRPSRSATGRDESSAPAASRGPAASLVGEPR